MVETPQPNLVVGMKWFLGTYTTRFNRRHQEFGHLFSGRYKALIVDGSATGYLKSVCDYVHLNPVRAGLVRTRPPLESYLWSSYGQYLKPPGQRWNWLRVDRLLGEWAIAKDSPAGSRRFGRMMEQRRKQESPEADWKAIEHGWCLGDEEFKAQLLAQVRQLRGDHYGPELRQADQAHALALLQKELRARNWNDADLARRRKGDLEKVEIAWGLRQQTSMTLKWIAQKLHMGSWTYLSNLLAIKRKENENNKSV